MGQIMVCEECGRRIDLRRVKEVFVWHGRERVRREVCASCLDRTMREGRVSGIVGHLKRAAVQITPGVEAGVRQGIK